MSDIGAEAAGAIILAFFGAGILLVINAALHGGNVSKISDIISAFALPVVVLAVIAFVAISLLQAISE